MYGDKETAERKAASRYKRKGYDVAAGAEARALLPRSLADEGLFPDLIASKGGRHIAVVIGERGFKRHDISEIRNAVEDEPGWDMDIIITDGTLKPPDEKPENIAEAIRRTKKLHAEGYDVPAYLALWACFEGAANKALKHHAPRTPDYPRAPGGLVKELVFNGVIGEEQHNRLMRLVKIRNAAAHGGVSTSVTREDFDYLAQVAQSLLDENQPNLPH